LKVTPKHPVPVFPLPDVVLFPHVILPVHVFELRYRTMVRDALSGERVIALALLKPGWEGDYQGSPEFHDLGCLARFEEVEWLPNDCYDLKLAGLARVHFDRVVREYPYRSAYVKVVEQEPYSEDDPLIQLEKCALIDAARRARGAPNEESHELPYEGLVNALCVTAVTDPGEKFKLFELDSVIERGRRLRETIQRQVRSEPPPPPDSERN
jgi:Lon protease-like protein